MQQNIPVPTIHLFPLLEEKLIELLRSLKPEEWDKPTIAKQWTVKDVAAHLFDGNIRTSSMLRDNYFPTAPGNINSNEDLVGYLNGLNGDWVKAMKRMSPKTLTDLMETTGKEYNRLMALQDPFAPAMFAVSWAGETSSLNWFHIAREYTERWHHQQQIRDAVQKPGIMHKELYSPVLETFMMALPYTYRDVNAATGTVLQVSITGEAGGEWYLVKNESWVLGREKNGTAVTQVSIGADIAWKLFTKSWRKKDVVQHIRIEGDISLADEVLNMVSVMA